MSRIHKFYRWWWKTEQEKKYIAALETMLDRILRDVGEKNIVALYVGGSFPRRELKPADAEHQSDIDFRLVVSDISLLPKLGTLRAEYMKLPGIKMELGFYALKELEDGAFIEKYGRHFPPTMWVKDIHDSALFYGEPINIDSCKILSDDEEIRTIMKKVRKELSNEWGDEKDRLVFISKRVLHMLLLETRIKTNEKIVFSQKELVRILKQRNEEIFDILLESSRNPAKYISQKKEIYAKVEEYLRFIEKEYFKL